MIFRPPEIIRRIICVQRGILHISFAQAVEKTVERTFCQCPVQCTGFAPFVQLTQLVAHEIQLFTRMREHIQIHHTRLRILVAFVRAPHFLHDCRLAVHNLVVRERQQVVLVGKIVHRPEQLAMVARAQIRLGLAELERIVHPAEIPLVVEAQAAIVHRTGDTGIGSRVLSDEQSRGMAGFQTAVHIFEEFERVAVDAACGIALPVDQARDRIHAQTVKMKLSEPVIGRRLQKTAHFPSGMNEIVAAPFTFADRAVRVLVQVRAIVFRQTVGVYGKVYRYKIHDRTDTGMMQFVNQHFQLCRRAVARGRSKKSGVLVAPGAVKRVLGQRQQLHMCVAVFLQIGNQLAGDFIVGVPAVCVVRIAHPRAEVHFVDIKRCVRRSRAAVHPRFVCEAVLVKVGDDRAAGRPQFHCKAVGIAVLGDGAVRAVDAVFVKLACAGVRHRDRPEAAAAVLYQIGLGPAVARAGQRNAAGIGRKGTENDSVLLYVSAKPVVGVENFACEELVLIHGSTSFLFPLTGDGRL